MKNVSWLTDAAALSLERRQKLVPESCVCAGLNTRWCPESICSLGGVALASRLAEDSARYMGSEP